jgi:hypothetical protein
MHGIGKTVFSGNRIAAHWLKPACSRA